MATPTSLEQSAAALPARAEPPPQLPRPVAAATAAVFKGLSTIRGRRSFHPHGVAFRGTLETLEPPGELGGAPLLGSAGSHEAVVRLSRGIGLPPALPDVLGVAVRLEDAHGRGLHQDFPLASSARAAVVQHLLVPGRGFTGRYYSSLLAYRIGGRLRTVGALVPPGPALDLDELSGLGTAGLRFQLGVMTLAGRWRQVGELALGQRVPPDETESLRYDPWNTGGGIRPVGPLAGIRKPAYEGSRRGRGAA